MGGRNKAEYLDQPRLDLGRYLEIQKYLNKILNRTYNCKTNIVFIVSYTGCQDIKDCKCNLVLKDAGKIPEIVLGEDKVLDVKFVLSNTGNEPAIGIVFQFSFLMNLEFVDGEKYDCKKTVISGGRSTLETDVSACTIYYGFRFC